MVDNGTMSGNSLDAKSVERLLDAVGAHLETEGVEVALVVVGGAALALRGWVPRTTQDVDVIAQADELGEFIQPSFPPVLVKAIGKVARDFNLPEDWLNDAVAMQWAAGMPDSLAEGIEWRVFRGLRVGLAGRSTLIALKLFAAVDRGPRSVHLQDLRHLQPTHDELTAAQTWVLTQDIAPQWPALVEEVLRHVRDHRTR
jgi:hypothetical protein